MADIHFEKLQQLFSGIDDIPEGSRLDEPMYQRVARCAPTWLVASVCGLDAAAVTEAS